MARFRTGTSTDDFADSDTNLLGLANKYYRKIVLAMADTNQDWYANITSLTLGNGSNPYALSSDSSLSGGGSIRILRLEVSYDGSTWQVANPLQREQISTPTIINTDITNNFSTSKPFYAQFGTNLYMFPDGTSNVTNGIRVFEVQRRKELTGSGNVFADVDATNDFQLPKEMMEIIEDYLTADLYERLTKFQEARVIRQDTDVKLARIAQSLARRNEDFDLSMQTADDYAE